MCDSCGCEMPKGKRSLVRTVVLGLALAAVGSLGGAFGFTTIALSANDAVAAPVSAANAAFCPCGDGGPCCGFCTPVQRQR